MGDYHYADNIHRRATRRRTFKIIAIILSVLLAAALILIVLDALRNKTNVSVIQTDERRILGQADTTRVFNEAHFSFQADETWQKVDTKEEFVRYNALTYRSLENGFSLRELTIFIDEYPEDYGLTYVLPVEIENNRITPQQLSPRCNQLLDDGHPKHLSTEAVWAGVSFICDPDRATYTIGASHSETGYGVRIEGTNAVHRYFFLYNDLESSPRFDVFSQILSSFEAK